MDLAKVTKVSMESMMKPLALPRGARRMVSMMLPGIGRNWVVGLGVLVVGRKVGGREGGSFRGYSLRTLVAREAWSMMATGVAVVARA